MWRLKKRQLSMKSFTKEWMSTHFEREDDPQTECKRTLFVGSSPFGGFFIMKKLREVRSRDIFIISKLSERHWLHFITTDENRPVSEFESGVVLFADILGSRRAPKGTSKNDQFFKRERHKDSNKF